MIVRLTGGLCNQLHQWSFGRSVGLKRGIPVQYHWNRATRDYALEPYNIKVDLVQASGPVYNEPSHLFDLGVYSAPENSYYAGYWQTAKYFNEEVIRKEITLREPLSDRVQELGKKLRNLNSVFIHVRRGDYVSDEGTNKFHGVLPIQYYHKAVGYIEERTFDVTFFVFSDDPKWCSIVFPYEVISGFKDYEDLWLMNQCEHAILANSSFGWFGSWLGDANKGITIAPKDWFADPNIDTSDLIPERWVRL